MEISAEVEQAIHDYFDYYSDEYMRLSLKPRLANKRGSYDNENPHLFTGMFATLMAALGIYEEQFMYQIEANMLEAQVVSGLFGRQAVGNNGYPKDHPQHGEHNSVSHDEYNGLVMQSAYIMDRSFIDDIVLYGKNNHWSYNDAKPFKFEMRYWRQPRDRFLYKACSESYKPSLVDKLWFYCSTILTSRSKGERVDGELMLFYKFLSLEMCGYRSKTVSKAREYYNAKMQERFGDSWVTELHQRYFVVNKHPIHVLAAEVQEVMRG